jgi:hypothetical protein
MEPGHGFPAQSDSNRLSCCHYGGGPDSIVLHPALGRGCSSPALDYGIARDRSWAQIWKRSSSRIATPLKRFFARSASILYRLT